MNRTAIATSEQATSQVVRVPKVLFVGDRTVIDFQPALQRISASAERSDCVLADVADLPSALQKLATLDPSAGELPDLIVLAQQRPGELEAGLVSQLRQHAPLAGIVVVWGSWCEGEARSGRPLPGIARVAWHQLPARWSRFLTDWQRQHVTEWSLPATWSDEEKLLHGASASEDLLVGLAVTIHSRRYGMPEEDWLHAFCRALAWPVKYAVQSGTADAIGNVAVWQADDLQSSAWEDLRNYCRQMQPAPVIAISGFPRPADAIEARAQGAVSLLARPLLIEELIAEVNWVLAHRE